MPDTFLLYGSYGYTGRLIAARALERGLRPVLAGRGEAPLRGQAEELGLPWRAVALDDPAALDAALADVPVVVHAAGPFSRTARPMAEACLRTGTHYLDITGEIAVFEALAALHADEWAAAKPKVAAADRGKTLPPIAAALKAVVAAAQERYATHELFPNGRTRNYCTYTKVDLEARGLVERVPGRGAQRLRLTPAGERAADARAGSDPRAGRRSAAR